MSVVMLILKIIGILLLLVFAAAALILFYPLSYQAQGECGDEVSARGAVWWLFRALRLEFSMRSGEVKTRFYIFGFLKKENEPKEEDIIPEGFGENESEEDVLESEVFEAGGTDRQKFDELKEGDSARDFKIEDLERSDSKKKKRRTRKRVAKKPVKTGRAKLAWQEVSDPRNHQAASHLWQELLYLLSHAKPKNIHADISFCTKDPALTGQIAGILSLLPFIYRYDAHICPDFVSDEYYVRGGFEFWGRMAAFHFARSLFRLVRDKHVMRLYRVVSRGADGE